MQQSAGKCDFCANPDIVWIYPAESFVMEAEDWGSEGGWAACDQCAKLIEAEDYQALADRTADAYQTSGPIKIAIRLKVVELHDQFRQHRTGPREKWTG